MQEIWKQIEETPYEISNLGRVKSHNYTRSAKTKIISGSIMRNGYRIISINKKKIYVHRLVAYYFVDGYKEGLYVNHIDGNKENNHYTNLEWVTNEENVRLAWKEGLCTGKNCGRTHTEEEKEHKKETSPKNMKVINTETGEIYRSCRELARQINSDNSALSKRIRMGKPFKGVLYKYL